jgi:hypothetical protein
MGYRKNENNTIHTITLTAEIPLIYDATTNSPFNLIYYYYLEKPNKSNPNSFERILENNLIERRKLRVLVVGGRVNQNNNKKVSLKLNELEPKELEKYDDLVLFGNEAKYSDSNVIHLLNKSRANFLDNLLPLDLIQSNIFESKNVLFKQLNDIYANLCTSEPFYKEHFERV